MGAAEAIERSRVRIDAESDVYGAAMLAHTMLTRAGAAATTAALVATVVSELGSNIRKHAGCSGSLLLSLRCGGAGYIEVLAEDYGVGMEDKALAMRDRYSSCGTLGVGLPGIARMMDEFEISSAPGRGTRVRAKKWLAPPEPSSAGSAIPTGVSGVEHEAVARPCEGEALSGDRVISLTERDGALAGVIDVLGHGAEAHALALHCARWIAGRNQPSLLRLVQELHTEIRGSRGIAITLARMDASSVELVGVGNVMAYGLQRRVGTFVPQPGIVGSNLPRLQMTVLAWRRGDVLLMASDGIAERLDSERLQEWRRSGLRHLVAELFRQHGKRYDDATCAAWRLPL